MGRKILVSFLLFICFFSFVSCNNLENLYNKGSYNKILEYLNQKENLTKNEHLIKIKTLYALGRQNEARESVLLYLLIASDDDERALPVELFINFNFSDTLNVLLLKLSDGFAAQSVIFKSLYNLNQYDKAKTVFNDYISKDLSIEEFLSVLIKYPIDNEYTLNFFEAWFDIISNDELVAFVDLFTDFLQLDLSDSCLSKTKVFINKILNSEYAYILNR